MLINLFVSKEKRRFLFVYSIIPTKNMLDPNSLHQTRTNFDYDQPPYPQTFFLGARPILKMWDSIINIALPTHQTYFSDILSNIYYF